jgi:hypothetical protein
VFRRWATTPAPYPRIQHEASLRVFAMDLLEDPRDVERSFEGLIEEIRWLERILDEVAQRAETIPHRTTGILLQLSLARGLLRTQTDWVRHRQQDTRRQGLTLRLPGVKDGCHMVGTGGHMPGADRPSDLAASGWGRAPRHIGATQRRAEGLAAAVCTPS